MTTEMLNERYLRMTNQIPATVSRASDRLNINSVFSRTTQTGPQLDHTTTKISNTHHVHQH